jgi:hypothetical protein
MLLTCLETMPSCCVRLTTESSPKANQQRPQRQREAGRMRTVSENKSDLGGRDPADTRNTKKGYDERLDRAWTSQSSSKEPGGELRSRTSTAPRESRRIALASSGEEVSLYFKLYLE